jgi:hypothetical protein
MSDNWWDKVAAKQFAYMYEGNSTPELETKLLGIFQQSNASRRCAAQQLQGDARTNELLRIDVKERDAVREALGLEAILHCECCGEALHDEDDMWACLGETEACGGVFCRQCYHHEFHVGRLLKL